MRTEDGRITGEPWPLLTTSFRYTLDLLVRSIAASDSRKYGVAAGY
jgi:hypothetical protein